LSTPAGKSFSSCESDDERIDSIATHREVCFVVL